MNTGNEPAPKPAAPGVSPALVDIASWLLTTQRAVEVWGLAGAQLARVEYVAAERQSLELDSGDWLLVRLAPPAMPTTGLRGVIRFRRAAPAAAAAQRAMGPAGSWLTLSASTARVAGTWSVTWTPPVETQTGVEPTPVPQACLTLEKWQQALAQPVPLPAETAGRLIAYGCLVEDHFTQPSAEGQQLRNLDLASGAITESTRRLGGKGVPAALSPDDQRLGYVESMPGQLGAGLYLAECGRRLLASVTNTDLFSPRSTPALISLATSQANALAGVEGEVSGWAPQTRR